MSWPFPAAVMANTFAVTCMMIVLGLAGESVMAADFGIVHGATVALLYSFSANARSIILNPAASISAGGILGCRLLLLIPLGLLSLWLSLHIARVETVLAVALVVRRCAEWIAEVHVSEMERTRDEKSAIRFLAIQAILFMAVTIWLAAGMPYALPALFLWATSPVWLSLRFLQRADIGSLAGGGWQQLLPHFGSTAIIGISVYVFRLLILLLVGKVIAGDLYTAFAIGGLLGSVFGHVIGPTLVLRETQGIARGFPLWIKLAIAAATAAGLGLYLAAVSSAPWLSLTGKTPLFWQAAGLSLVGSAIMVVAWHIRLKILQQQTENDVFGPDVLTNILIVAAVPYAFYLLGLNGLAGLYLLSAVLALLFYFSAEKSVRAQTNPDKVRGRWIDAGIALLLFLPLFFQLSGTVFRDPDYLFDSKGNLMLLPIPVSVLACYGGILLLGRFSRATLALILIFSMFALMLLTSVLLAHVEPGHEQAKLILLIQFVLPMFALVLGQLYGVNKCSAGLPVVAACFLWLLAFLVPVQLFFTWLGSSPILSPSLGLFSAYQHLQYVPVMFVAAYLLGLYTLWEDPLYRKILLGMGAALGIYTGASVSALANAGLIAGVVAFAVIAGRRSRPRKPLVALVLAVLVCSIGYFSVATGRMGPKYDLIHLQTDAATFAPKNLAQRIAYWKFYAGEILASPKSAVLGHVAPPDRTKYPSAHNYYLDFAYNFGIVPLLPLLGLIGLTLFGVRRQWHVVKTSLPLLGLTAVVLFLLLVDNSFKVGMRQPYPGILTFFLWGLLLTWLFKPSASERDRAVA
ncbi:MAG: hypothetical protein ACK59Y_00040 [Betaproteobacteria bacterium]|jgi:hypothetical protein|nr:hypothetical protein [Betaproteobacteria bacterium]